MKASLQRKTKHLLDKSGFYSGTVPKSATFVERKATIKTRTMLSEKINLEIFRLFEEDGIQFSLPFRYTRWKHDGGQGPLEVSLLSNTADSKAPSSCSPVGHIAWNVILCAAKSLWKFTIPVTPVIAV